MAFTRFRNDPCQIQKDLQQSTDVGRWILNVPGNGDKPCYFSDPHIRIQTWGGNLMTNSINLESELKGVGRNLVTRDCMSNLPMSTKNSTKINYPTCNMFTEESRSVMPAWTARDLEQVDWYILPLNPQENTCIPFHNNISTRILQKDHFVQEKLQTDLFPPHSKATIAPANFHVNTLQRKL